MRLYETTFILGPQADEATFDRQINAVSELIQRYNGKIVNEDRVGIRRLAYPIKKFTQGYYTKFLFSAENKVLSELDRFYRLEEAYIRYLTIRFEGSLDEEKAPTGRPYAGSQPVKKIKPAIETGKKPEDSSDEKPEEKTEVPVKEAETVEESAKENPVESTEEKPEEPGTDKPE